MPRRSRSWFLARKKRRGPVRRRAPQTNHERPPIEEDQNQRKRRPHFARVNFVYGVVFVAMGSLIVRLGFVQINEGASFHKQAAMVAVQKLNVLPSRGWIFDANGQLLAYNKPSYSVSLQIFSDTKQNFHNMAQELAPVFHVNARKLENQMAQKGVPAKDRLAEITLFKNISQKQLSFIEEHLSSLPGITIQSDGKREYPNGDLAGHVLGYTGAITADDKDAYLHPKDGGPKYILTQKVGRAGIEYQYERLLQGKVGQEDVLVDASGDTQQQLGFNPPPTPGKTLQLTLDGHLQAVAQEALYDQVQHAKNPSHIPFAAAVMMDVHDGSVLAMASYPYFDPNWYTPGNGGYLKHQKYIHNSNALMNHVIQGPQTVGSTVKPGNLILALENGIITPLTTIVDSPYINVATYHAHDDAYHGVVTPIKAIAESCDTYFYEVGLYFAKWFGSTEQNGGAPADGKGLYEWAKTDFWQGYVKLMMGEWAFGLGPKTGIDLPGEDMGNWWVDVLSKDRNQQVKSVQPPEIAKTLKQQGRVNIPAVPVDAAFIGMGQLQQYTPIQLVQYAAMLANGGKRIQPHLLKAVYPPVMKKTLPKNLKPLQVVKPHVESTMKIKPQYLQIAQEGMLGALNSPGGTAYSVFHNAPYKAAGKTGTAEITINGRQVDNSVFIAYAPYNNPQVAVAVMIPGAGYGADAAGPVARKLLDTYFAERHASFIPKKDWQNTSIPANWKESNAYQQPEQSH
ncbi:MAG: peptidoglycan glycosyltransferase [Alicyclobacillus herbarius]|uniref:peptidoglycan D,D-transpeptidase FtsI family protein n=1 Tax=Alicyclobacillus herbarius TaxID=122960 RepID=UPI002352BB86|nr:penicillin-binding transpeptidase domain-containing protein [Alicyclobacillus herbarius]MCL6632447.1 peptidoglycan glycosyltransferase [Alicyclobacillus herbarius]